MGLDYRSLKKRNPSQKLINWSRITNPALDFCPGKRNLWLSVKSLGASLFLLRWAVLVGHAIYLDRSIGPVQACLVQMDLEKPGPYWLSSALLLGLTSHLIGPAGPGLFARTWFHHKPGPASNSESQSTFCFYTCYFWVEFRFNPNLLVIHLSNSTRKTTLWPTKLVWKFRSLLTFALPYDLEILI